MPRIVVTSDLHLGITPEDAIGALVPCIAAEQPDLTILAGDLGERLDNFVRCLGLFAGLHGQVGVLAGNHDVWSRRANTSQSLFERELPRATREVGFLWLEDTMWSRDGVAVAGSLAWYDYSAADPSLPPMPPEWYAANKGRYNMDAHLIDWPWTDVAFAARLAGGLSTRLAAIEDDPAIQTAIVVTHVPLVEAQISRKPGGDTRWGTSNAYFGNLTTGARVLGFPKVAAIVSGHTHIGRDATIPRPTAGGAGYDSLRVSVVPSDYGAPAYVVVEAGRESLEMRVVGPSASTVERAAGSVRRAYGIARRTMQIARKRIWPN